MVDFLKRMILPVLLGLIDLAVVGGLAYSAGRTTGRAELFAYRAQVAEQRRIDNAALHRCQAKSCPQSDAPDRLGALLPEGRGNAE
ncbi:hypothetical protein ACFFU8_17785 [Chromobacterium piscinae]|uniref:hypothetical protein n=1 Tax=Chromobacterium piscinae TaxID=686831 RepID=UPI001E50E550|nr:hypothetical protein [Chromobacterium piscinae]MCD5329606.1 hypothetical protein [Chromobacterium piscinae]